ncbi:MAG TPA: hypothetical protein VFK02_02410 [Kofleriaceae bacterium]|nr:hypothetical protein [Kofleriaceae bacterium]
MRLLAGVSLLWAGCIYVDPVNRRPKISSVELCDMISTPAVCGGVDFPDLHRGDSIKLRVSFQDLDGDEAHSVFHWNVAVCDANLEVCEPFPEMRDASPELVIQRTLVTTGGPVQKIAVDLDLYDDRGAVASAHPVFTVNEGPTLALGQSARTYTVGAPVKLLATYGDPDAGPPGTPPTGVQLAWTVIPPPGASSPFTLTDFTPAQNADDPGHVTVGKTLIVQDPGDWDVRVIATSPHQKTNEKHLKFPIDPDLPPCLAQWQPIVPPKGTSLPVSEPTLFVVPVVTDDLDPYPQLVGEPLFGTASFEWSILPPGATTRQPLAGATGNSVDLDPRAFKPGDLLELRVEVFDRNHLPVACPDGEPVCADVNESCTRRQTWRVEVR